MHRTSRTTRVRLGVTLAALIAAILGFAAFAGSSSAAGLPPIPPKQTAIISNAEVLASCTIQVDKFNFDGTLNFHLAAQSQASTFGFLVKGTKITCIGEDAASTVVGTYQVVGTGPTILATRKTFVNQPVSSDYNVCIVVTTFNYLGGSTTSGPKCTT